MTKITEIWLVITSFLIYQANEMGTSIISKAFDQLFSLGLLAIVVVMLYREWKKSQTYNEERDDRLEELITNNTKALNHFSEVVKSISNRVEENRRLIDNYDRSQNN